jgi:hypothetical protein
MVAPGKLTGVQIKVVPAILLLAVKEEEVPAHTLIGKAETVMTGLGLTDIVTDAVPVHEVAGLVPVTV